MVEAKFITVVSTFTCSVRVEVLPTRSVAVAVSVTLLSPAGISPAGMVMDQLPSAATVAARLAPEPNRTMTVEPGSTEEAARIVGRETGDWDAWDAAYAETSGQEITDLVSLVLTDVEMPEMDGYILTKKIKSDPRFAGVPVIMHSSLSGMSNQQVGKSVGVDEYVPKFEAQKLSETLTRRLLGSLPVVHPNT